MIYQKHLKRSLIYGQMLSFNILNLRNHANITLFTHDKLFCTTGFRIPILKITQTTH